MQVRKYPGKWPKCREPERQRLWCLVVTEEKGCHPFQYSYAWFEKNRYRLIQLNSQSWEVHHNILNLVKFHVWFWRVPHQGTYCNWVSILLNRSHGLNILRLLKGHTAPALFGILLYSPKQDMILTNKDNHCGQHFWDVIIANCLQTQISSWGN